MRFDDAVLLARFISVQWSVKISLKMGVLEEKDGAVVSVSWPLPSGLVSSHWSASNECFQL